MTFGRPFSDEVFPDEAGYEGPRTVNIFQGQENACTTMGATNSLESYVHAWEEQQNLPLADSLQLSPAFIWRLLKLQPKISVETAIAALNAYGTCLEKFYPYVTEPNYPYRVTTLDNDPPSEAWVDANSRSINARIQRINGKWAMIRALANGYRLVTCRVGGNLEHIEAGIRYQKDTGIRIHGSGNSRFWEPWASFEMGGPMSQVYSIECGLAPRIVHPDYRAPTPASFKDGVLTCPFIAQVDPDWQKPLRWFKNVQAHFSGEITPQSLIVDDGNISGMDALWKPRGPGVADDRLELPSIEVGGTLYKNVSVNGVTITVVAGEEIFE